MTKIVDEDGLAELSTLIKDATVFTGGTESDPPQLEGIDTEPETISLPLIVQESFNGTTLYSANENWTKIQLSDNLYMFTLKKEITFDFALAVNRFEVKTTRVDIDFTSSEYTPLFVFGSVVPRNQRHGFTCYQEIKNLHAIIYAGVLNPTVSFNYDGVEASLIVLGVKND